MNHDTGINEKNMAEIVGVLKRHKKIESAAIFGSRAKGNFSPFSDVDIAVYGNCDGLDTEAIISDLDDLPMVYIFDVVAYNLIQNPFLRRHIDTVGVMIYK